jgi:predicted O-methyltransferase YrrM
MNFSLKKIWKYCESLSTPADDLLVELDRETNLKTLAPQMQSGPFQGLLLYFITQMKSPKCVLEVGTFTAYSTICFAKAAKEDCQIHTIEANEELKYIIDKYIAQLDNSGNIHSHIGDAKALIPKMDFLFDLVFVDAGKRDYEFYFDLLIDKVLNKEKDNDTRVMHAFNQKILSDDRVENIILPIRDGLMIIRKK